MGLRSKRSPSTSCTMWVGFLQCVGRTLLSGNFKPGKPAAAKQATCSCGGGSLTRPPHPVQVPHCSIERVQAVQYRKLGPPDFAARHVTGFLRGGSYERIPLEINAYQLDAEYTRNPKRQFAVEERVQTWIDRDKF